MSNPAFYESSNHIFYSDTSTDVIIQAPEGQNLIFNGKLKAVGNDTELQFNDQGTIKGCTDLNYNSGTGETLLKKILLKENGNNFDNLTIRKGETGLYVNDTQFGLTCEGFESFRIDKDRVVNTSDLFSNNISGFRVNDELIYYAPDLFQSDGRALIRYQGTSSQLGIKNESVYLFVGGPFKRTNANNPNGKVYLYQAYSTNLSYFGSFLDQTNIAESNVGKSISLNESSDIFVYSNNSVYSSSRLNVLWNNSDTFSYKTNQTDYDFEIVKVSGTQNDNILISSTKTGTITKFNWDGTSYISSQVLRTTGDSTISTYDAHDGTLISCWDGVFRYWTQPYLSFNFTSLYTESTTSYGTILFAKAYKSVFIYTSARNIIIHTRAGPLITDALVGRDEFLLTEDITGICCNEKYVFVVSNTGIYTFYREKTNQFIQRDTKLLVAGPRSCACTNNILTVGIPAYNTNEGLNKMYQIDNITNSLVETTSVLLNSTDIIHNANQNTFLPVTGSTTTIKTNVGKYLNIDCNNVDCTVLTTDSIYPKTTNISLVGDTDITGTTINLTGNTNITGTNIDINGITTNTGNFKVIGDAEITGTLTTTSITYDTAFKLMTRTNNASQSITAGTENRILFNTSLVNEITNLTVTTVSSGSLFTCITKPLRAQVSWCFRCDGGSVTKPETYLRTSNSTIYLGQNINYTTGSYGGISSSCIVNLDVGDSFYISTWTNGTTTISADTSFRATALQIYTLL